jgi:Putative zinc-finger/WD40-like Beta Propeller Repeat
MNCEQVKELLSPYLDSALAQEERRTVVTHLAHCAECNRVLADFQNFDTLLARMPRIGPDAALRERIFSSPAYFELTGTSGALDRRAQPTAPQQRVQSGAHPHLVALPARDPDQQPSAYRGAGETARKGSKQQRNRGGWGQRVMQVVIAATVLLTLGVGGFIGWNLWLKQTTMANNSGGITPPAALQQGPIAAGTRFVFLRNGALWSAPTDGGDGVRRLTTAQSVVATSWTVRPALVGRHAGNLVAYIDLQQGFVHTIRSDGQNDTVIRQPLFQPGQGLQWQTTTGATIRDSLTWSKDGSMLAFIAAPRGVPQLYVYMPGTREIRQVTLPMPGAVTHPVWSPDNVRLAFEVQANGNVYLLDYNIQASGVLTLSTVSERPGNTVLSLDWSPNTAIPALTWSIGGAGHVHSIWTQRVGVAQNIGPSLLASGDYLEAQYSQNGSGGTGSWLLVAGNPVGTVVTLNLAGGIEKVTAGQHISNAQWSPDGLSIGYFTALASGSGTYHVVNTLTGIDTLIAKGVVTTPSPAWSSDGSHLVYSTGTRTLIVDLQKPATARALKQQGMVTAFSWSATDPTRLVLVQSNGQQGIYLIDTQRYTSLQLDKGTIQGPLQWTEIP